MYLTLITTVVQYFLSLILFSLFAASAFGARWLRGLSNLLPSTAVGRSLTAIVFLVAGLATIAGSLVPFVAFFSAILALGTSIFLVVRVLLTKHSSLWALPALVASASVAVALGQPLGLKVLLLPKADELPVEPAPFHVVKTYDEGLWFEGIASGHDGTLYLSGNRGLDFSRRDYYHAAQGEVIARSSDGQERKIFETPKGTTAGVIAIAADGTLYMTSHGESPCIWHIAIDRAAEQVSKLPSGAWPNGLDIGPDGKLYAADSAMGLIWRIDPVSKSSDAVIQDALLEARRFFALAPGANGVHFNGNDLYVTVSDKTTVLRYKLDESGKFSAAEIVATGIPGDDFAIGRDGALFVTTHPYNTLVRVSSDGGRKIIGGSAQHIVGATDAVFGKGSHDGETLYVVTDGGAFTGGPKTRGELIAVEPLFSKNASSN